ncbi:MAG: hypothetical protein RIC55_10140 [Pirellulaceae bacterium]
MRPTQLNVAEVARLRGNITSSVLPTMFLGSWRRRRYGLSMLFVATTVCAIGFGAWRYVHRVNAAKAEYNTAQGFHWALYGLAEWDAKLGRLPKSVVRDSADTPLSSWRFLVAWSHTTAMQHEADYRRHWNAAPNAQLASNCDVGGAFCIGSEWSGRSCFETNVMAVVGPGTAFDDAVVQTLASLEPDQIVLVEVSQTDVHWMEPGDVDVEEVEELLKAKSGRRIGGNFPQGFHVAFADGEVWFLRADVPYQRLAKFLTKSSAKAHRREAVLEPYMLDIERERKWMLN